MPTAQPTGSQTLTSASTIKFTWEITNFSQLTAEYYYSRPFIVGINRWRVLVHPKGEQHSPGYLSLFLTVDGPNGWATCVDFSLTVVNQRTPYSSVKGEVWNQNFYASSPDWGYPDMITLESLHNDGFLVNDTLIIQVGIVVKDWQVDTSLKMIESYFSSLEEYISMVNEVHGCCSKSPSDAHPPTLEEVEVAKRSLKECLLVLFKLNVKDGITEALSTLSRAEVGLSAGQASSVRAFWDQFGVFPSGFLSFEQVNSEFDSQKLLKDQMFLAVKKCHERHMRFKEESKKIEEEEEECERKIEELSKRKEELSKSKERLASDWGALMAESQVATSKYAEQEKKAKDAEEKKRVAVEWMSRSTAVWSSLKSEFT